MQLTRRMRAASALVGVAVAAYLGYLAFGSVPLVQDVRGLAAVGLILGFASRRVGGQRRVPAPTGGHGRQHRVRCPRFRGARDGERSRSRNAYGNDGRTLAGGDVCTHGSASRGRLRLSH